LKVFTIKKLWLGLDGISLTKFFTAEGAREIQGALCIKEL
jgi:hypothetical protein